MKNKITDFMGINPDRIVDIENQIEAAKKEQEYYILGGLPEYMQLNILELKDKYNLPLEDIKRVYLMGSDTDSILRMMEKDINMSIELVYSLQKIGVL